jgi:hypothetical protein
VCTRVAFAKDSCPPSSRLGNVEVVTPLLDQPLTGFAYLRSSQNPLPDLALKLKGQVEIEALAKIDSVNEGLRTSFRAIPDIPFSLIRLNLAGGKKGLLQNTNSLCGKPKYAVTKIVAQNGMERRLNTELHAKCGSKGRHRRHGEAG